MIPNRKLNQNSHQPSIKKRRYNYVHKVKNIYKHPQDIAQKQRIHDQLNELLDIFPSEINQIIAELATAKFVRCSNHAYAKLNN